MCVIQSKFTKQTRNFFQNGGGGGARSLLACAWYVKRSPIKGRIMLAGACAKCGGNYCCLHRSEKNSLNETFTNTWHRLFLLYCLTPFESKTYLEGYRCQSTVVTILDAILKAVGMYTTVQELRFRVSIRWPVAITWLCRSFTNSQNPSLWWKTYSGNRETCTAFFMKSEEASY